MSVVTVRGSKGVLIKRFRLWRKVNIIKELPLFQVVHKQSFRFACFVVVCVVFVSVCVCSNIQRTLHTHITYSFSTDFTHKSFAHTSHILTQETAYQVIILQPHVFSYVFSSIRDRIALALNKFIVRKRKQNTLKKQQQRNINACKNSKEAQCSNNYNILLQEMALTNHFFHSLTHQAIPPMFQFFRYLITVYQMQRIL